MKDTVRVFVIDDEPSVERVWQASRLWAWDGVSWHSFDTPGPELRRHIKVAYDTARGRLALYGGYDDAGREMYSERHHLTWSCGTQATAFQRRRTRHAAISTAPTLVAANATRRK